MNSSHELLSTRLAVMGSGASQREVGIFEMPSSVIRPTRSDAKVQSEQELEFERLRTAVKIMKRMREAGISCELLDDLQDRH